MGRQQTRVDSRVRRGRVMDHPIEGDELGPGLADKVAQRDEAIRDRDNVEEAV